jgi:hypothetical protein
MKKMDERLRKFLGKPKTYDIEGEQITLTPLTGKDLDVVANLSEDKDSIKKLVLLALKQAFPDATEEDYDLLPVGFLNKLAEAFIDVNGLKK